MAKAAKQLVPVSERALLQRINRKLAPDYEQVKKSRPSRFSDTLGEYYRIDMECNFILQTHEDIEKLGRKLRALDPWEELVREET